MIKIDFYNGVRPDTYKLVRNLYDALETAESSGKGGPWIRFFNEQKIPIVIFCEETENVQKFQCPSNRAIGGTDGNWSPAALCENITCCVGIEQETKRCVLSARDIYLNFREETIVPKNLQEFKETLLSSLAYLRDELSLGKGGKDNPNPAGESRYNTLVEYIKHSIWDNPKPGPRAIYFNNCSEYRFQTRTTNTEARSDAVINIDFAESTPSSAMGGWVKFKTPNISKKDSIFFEVNDNSEKVAERILRFINRKINERINAITEDLIYTMITLSEAVVDFES